MKRARWAILGWGLLLVGCASFYDSQREDIFEENSKSYSRLIRWSNFEAARAFLAPAQAAGDAPLPKDVRVTDYEVKQMAYSQDRYQMIQVVEISFYFLKDYRIRKLEDYQVWEYDSKRKAWLLKTGLPKF
jgi:hypothetical protein